MSLTEIAQVLYRRWWVVVSVLVLTLVAVWLTISTDSEYQATATLLLASPELGGSGQQVPEAEPTFNPSVVVEIVDGDDTRVKLGSEFDISDYSVTATGENIIEVEARSDTPNAVVRTADAVVDEILLVVEALNADAPGTEAVAEVLSRPQLARERTVEDPTGAPVVEYYATGSVLVNGAGSIEAAVPNPYTASEGTLRVLVEVASPGQVRQSILDEVNHGDPGFELVFDSRDIAPVLHVVATASEPAAAMQTLNAVVAFLDGDLAERQVLAGADESTFVWFQRLAYPDRAEPATGGVLRPIATIVVLGVVAAVSLAVLVDTAIAYRTKRRSAAGRHVPNVGGKGVETESPERALDPAQSREAS
jgi:hypothetical protein